MDGELFTLRSLASAAHVLLLLLARRLRARFLGAISNAIDFDQHAGRMAQVATNGRTHGIGPRKTTSIDCVVACEETQLTEVGVDLDYIAQRNTSGLENGGN